MKSLTIYFNKNLPEILIILFAFSLRIPGFLYGLPDFPDPTEPELIAVGIKIFKGNLFPHYYLFPSFYLYLISVIVGCVHAFYHTLHFFGLFGSPHTPYWHFFAACRLMNVFLSVGTIIIIIKLGTLTDSRRTGILAGLTAAILPMHNTISPPVIPDTLLLFLLCLSLLYSAKYMCDNKTPPKYLYLSALFAGLSVGTKYMFIAPAGFLIAKWLTDRKSNSPFLNKILTVSIGVCALAFFLSTPIFVFRFKEIFLDGMLFQHKAYSSGGTNTMLFSFVRYLFLRGVTPFFFILLFPGLYFLIKKKNALSIVICIVPFLWFVILSRYKLSQLHNLVSLSIPFSISIGFLLNQIPQKNIIIPIFIIAAAWPLKKDFEIGIVRSRPDIRYPAREWVNNNLPPGSHIALEEYTFFPDSNFKTTYIGICGLAHITPDSVRKAGFDYILSAGHERWIDQPKENNSCVANYQAHLHEFSTIQFFDPGTTHQGQPIRILKVEPE